LLQWAGTVGPVLGLDSAEVSIFLWRLFRRPESVKSGTKRKRVVQKAALNKEN